MQKSFDAFRTISEVADDLQIPQHVLRFWETRFEEVKPVKKNGGRRYYRPEDVTLIRRIADLLYIQGYTIKGVQKLFAEEKEKVMGTQKKQEANVSSLNENTSPKNKSDKEAESLKLDLLDFQKDTLLDQKSTKELLLCETLRKVLDELEILKKQLNFSH
ncbi:MerR HTH family regulatory protein [Entomobacter blattae]|uniref:MerR HTH family regulatory protein n=1 Tax=Entomobacter blattae TaxID=2762277 RepID=A0A7H1NSU0_9PROT|nr:MerR family transcriptional regulator [Entomobacter blattae]QNT78850.1 MerR HTH family regulatory protein [Entomobacter blattae]